jgi:hypothetical protein
MRIAIFSDIHGNRHALDATLPDLKAQQPDRVYCLGDLVGYAPFPNDVTERIRAEGYPTIMGNYDDGVGFDRDECGCAYKEALDQQLGQQSLEWTKAHTTPEKLLASIPVLCVTAARNKTILLNKGRLETHCIDYDRPRTYPNRDEVTAQNAFGLTRGARSVDENTVRVRRAAVGRSHGNHCRTPGAGPCTGTESRSLSVASSTAREGNRPRWGVHRSFQ